MAERTLNESAGIQPTISKPPTPLQPYQRQHHNPAPESSLSIITAYPLYYHFSVFFPLFHIPHQSSQRPISPISLPPSHPLLLLLLFPISTPHARLLLLLLTLSSIAHFSSPNIPITQPSKKNPDTMFPTDTGPTDMLAKSSVCSPACSD
jgi:hypothetical protein